MNIMQLCAIILLYYIQFQTEYKGPCFSNRVYFRRGLTRTLGVSNDLIDGGQLRAKPHSTY